MTEIEQLKQKAKKAADKATEYQMKYIEFLKEAVKICPHPEDKVVAWWWLDWSYPGGPGYFEEAQCTQCGLRDSKYKFLPQITETIESDYQGPKIAQETFTIYEWRK